MSNAQVWYALIAGSIILLMAVLSWAGSKPSKGSKTVPYSPSMRDR